MTNSVSGQKMANEVSLLNVKSWNENIQKGKKML